MHFFRANSNPDGVIARALAVCRTKLLDMWRSKKPRHRLLVRETAALGERRFVAVIECERQRFLIGASPGSVTLLARLEDERPSGQEQP